MAAIYGSRNFWKNTTLVDFTLTLQRLLQDDFSAITLATGIIIAVLGPVTTLANSVVIAAIWKDPFKNLRSSPSNIIIASMAACDFLAGTVGSALPAFWFISMSSFTAPNVLINVAPVSFGIIAFLINLSVFHDLALTIDRVIAVVNPMLYKSRVTSKRVLTSVFLIWAFYLIVALLQIPLFNRYFIYNVIFVVILILADGIASCLCLFIIYYFRKQTKKIKKNMEEGNNVQLLVTRQRKLTKSILLICLVLRLCFSPFFISWSILITCFSCHSNLRVLSISFCLSIALMHLNFCINPFIYAFRLPKFKKPVALIVKSVKCCKFSLTDSRTDSSRTALPSHLQDSRNERKVNETTQDKNTECIITKL